MGCHVVQEQRPVAYPTTGNRLVSGACVTVRRCSVAESKWYSLFDAIQFVEMLLFKIGNVQHLAVSGHVVYR